MKKVLYLSYHVEQQNSVNELLMNIDSFTTERKTSNVSKQQFQMMDNALFSVRSQLSLKWTQVSFFCVPV